MREQEVLVFTEKEEEFVSLLIRIGTQKNVAKMLVFLANIKEATSRQIERGADMRQPEACLAIKYLSGQGWIKSREAPSEKQGRPEKHYSLAVPARQIITSIEKAKKNELNSTLSRVRKVREYI
jgi:predicted transcriptional regulator